eukprot:6204812-Ditylum_brightwellii.AAC.1
MEGVISLKCCQVSRNFPYKTIPHTDSTLCTQSWLKNTPMPSIPVTHTESTAIKQQIAIDWRQLFNGHMSKCGQTYKTSTYKTLNSIRDVPMVHHGPNMLSN